MSLMSDFRAWHNRRYALHERSFGVIPYRVEGGTRQYLLIQHRGGHWGFPKGHAEHGEDPIQTAARELYEETGVAADLDTAHMFEQRYLVRRPIGLIPKTVGYFVGAAQPGPVTMQLAEIQDYAWLSYTDAYKRINHRDSRDILAAAQLYLDR